MDSEMECAEWITFLTIEVARQKKAVLNVGKWKELQAKIRSTYESFWSQVTVALLIFCSFITTVLENELDAVSDAASIQTLEFIDLIFTGIFAMVRTKHAAAVDHYRSSLTLRSITTRSLQSI